MKLSTRFSEYAVLGTFWWIAQCVTLLLTGNQGFVSRLLSKMSAIYSAIPPESHFSANSLMAASAFVVVLLTGYCFDVVGSACVFWEMRCFHKQVRHHREWMFNLARKHDKLFLDDLESLSNDFQDWCSWESFRSKETFGEMRRNWLVQFRLLRVYRRLFEYLYAFVWVYAGDKTGMLLDQLTVLCRLGRGISTILALWCLEVFLWSFVLLNHMLNEESLNRVWCILTWNAVMIVVSCVAAFFSVRSFTRMLTTLFSLVYMTYAKSEPSR